MTGKFHSLFNIPFGILTAVIMITLFGFGYQYLFVAPIAWFFATWPDIDQTTSVPRRWRLMKSIIMALVFFVFIAAIIGLFYFGSKIINQQVQVEEVIKYIGPCIGILVFYAICWIYTRGKNGKFLTAHRGFTHTLILPIILVLLFIQLNEMLITSTDNNTILIIKALQVVVAGICSGIIGHIFLDLTCKAGCPILWPLTKKNISIGKAITSDPRNPRQPHISSIITTVVWGCICIVATVIILLSKGFIIK